MLAFMESAIDKISVFFVRCIKTYILNNCFPKAAMKAKKS